MKILCKAGDLFRARVNTYNLEKNICRLFHVLGFSTIYLHHKWNGTNFYHQKVNVRVESRVAERLKT